MSSFQCVSCLLLALVLFLSVLSPVSSLYFHVKEGGSRCFLEELPEDHLIVGHYRFYDEPLLRSLSLAEHSVEPVEGISSPGSPSMFISVYTPNREQILLHEAREQGSFVFSSVGGGEYSICVRSNLYTRSAAKQLSFRFELAFDFSDQTSLASSSEDDKDKERLAQTEHFSAIQVELMKLNNKLKNIRNEQEYTKKREARHRDTSEEINSRIVFFGLFQLLVVAGGGAFTFWNLRRFFKAKKIA